MNGAYIRDLPVKELTQRCLPFLVEAGFLQDVDVPEMEMQELQEMVGLAQERVKKLSEIAPAISIFFVNAISYEETAVKKIFGREEAAKTLSEAGRVLRDIQSWKRDQIEKDLRTLQQELNIKPRIVFQVIRVAITGKTVSLPLFETLELLGRDRTLERLEQARSLMSGT
jgi:glutamyl-tRNA synthetase